MTQTSPQALDTQSLLEEQFQNDGKVLVGKNDWLFLAHDTNHCLRQHIGDVHMARETVLKWQQLYLKRLKYFRKNNIAFYTLIAPTKESIYDDYLPEEFSPKSPSRTLHQFLHLLEPLYKHTVIAPEQALIDARRTRETYIQTDVHWNEWGAFVAYQEMMRAILKHLPYRKRWIRRACPVLSESDVSFVEVPFTRGLGIKLQPPQTSSEWVGRVDNPKAKAIYYNRIPRNGSRTTVENPTLKGAPRCLIFGNSFGQYLLKYMGESFSRVDYVFSYSIDYKLVERLKPDIVIYQSVERYLISCPHDSKSLLLQIAAKLRAVPDQAVDIYLKSNVANLACGEPDAYFIMSLLLLRQKRIAEAMQMYQIALSLSPNTPEYHQAFADFLAIAEGTSAALKVHRM